MYVGPAIGVDPAGPGKMTAIVSLAKGTPPRGDREGSLSLRRPLPSRPSRTVDGLPKASSTRPKPGRHDDADAVSFGSGQPGERALFVSTFTRWKTLAGGT